MKQGVSLENEPPLLRNSVKIAEKDPTPMGEGAAGCFGRSSDKGVEMKTFGWREIDSSLFRGYIDESYNDQVFVLSCLMAGAHSWLWIG